MTFDPKKYVIRVQGGREYLPVAARLVWFRGEHPDWGIVTNPVEINMEKQYAIFGCSIFNADGKLMATATKMEDVRGFPDFLEKAETGSVGRALAYCGYGTQFAPELEENTRFADAPQQGRGGSTRGDSNGNPAAGTACVFEGCGIALTGGQIQMSVKKFGRALCPAHQRVAPPVQESAAPATESPKAGGKSQEYLRAVNDFRSALRDAGYTADSDADIAARYSEMCPKAPRDRAPSIDELGDAVQILWDEIDAQAEGAGQG